jgi:hypothetical protein
MAKNGHNTLVHHWSRSVLVHQIESGLYGREGKAITNFTKTLPPPQSDLALQTLEDPYVFDFLTMTKRRRNLPVPNVTNLSILASLTTYPQGTHPASSKLLKNVEEAPLSRGE